MKKIDINCHGKANIWINDNPEIIYPVSEVITQDVGNGLSRIYEKKRVTVELLIPVGARFLYGLLGAQFIPNDAGKLCLEVLVSTYSESIFHESIASQLDVVRVGLPREYSQSVSDEVLLSLNSQAIKRLGSGVLQFNQAAHGEIGSSNKLFRRIASTVVQLLIIDSDNNEKEVERIVKTYTFA